MQNKIRFGIAPIGWRNDDIPEIGKENTYQHILSEAKLAGYEGTEVGGCYPKDVTELKKEVQLRDTAIVGQWFSGFLIRDGLAKVRIDFERQCEYLAELKADVIVYSEQTYSIQGLAKPIFEKKPEFTAAEWKILATGLDKLGEIALSYQLKLVYHHHLGTGVQTLAEVDKLMSMTDPQKVFLLYDTGHIFASDGEVLPLLKKYITRIAHVHFKDIRATQLTESKKNNFSFQEAFLAGMFTVPGDGSISYPEIYQILQEQYQGWIVVEAEQDPKKANPFEYALKGIDYLKKM